MKDFTIDFTSYADPVAKQLKRQGYKFVTPAVARRKQKVADAITLLFLDTYITTATAIQARKRLLRDLQTCVCEINPRSQR